MGRKSVESLYSCWKAFVDEVFLVYSLFIILSDFLCILLSFIIDVKVFLRKNVSVLLCNQMY